MPCHAGGCGACLRHSFAETSHGGKLKLKEFFFDTTHERREQERGGSALGLKKNYHGEPFAYYFGSAWSAYDMPTFAHWTLECQESLDNLKHPLILTIR